MEICDRFFGRDNEVTIRWAPAYTKVAGNEEADAIAKAAARRTAPRSDEEISDEFLQEAGLSHMSRSATEARSRAWQSGSPATCAPSAGTGPPRGEAPATSTCAAQRRSWPGGITSSTPATQRSDRTSRTRYIGPIRTSAGGATPASASPDSTSRPGARLGPARLESCGRGFRGCARGGVRWPRR